MVGVSILNFVVINTWLGLSGSLLTGDFMVIKRKRCFECVHSETHSTGSQLWLSCKFKDGWFSMESFCDLDGQTVLTKDGVEVKT